MHSDPQQAYLDGNHHMAAGDFAVAEDCYLQALVLEPMHGAARANLGYLKERQGALAEAEFHYRLALALMPDHAQLHQNLGVLLLQAKRFDEAEAAARAAVELAPDSPAAWSQLGVLLACVKREQEAEQCYRRALALDPDHARTRFNLAYVLLRQGRFEEGWPLLEARWQFDSFAHTFACPRWEGEPLQGKSIVIVLEAGQGDMIQFCRYASSLKERGAARVAVICHAGLKRLFATLVGVDEVYALEDAVPADGWDYWTHPMRLPAQCNAAAIPYLAAEPELMRHWAAQLPAHGLRVGLAWKGNPDFENDADRSLPSLQVLAPLAAAPGAHFISLQKGPGEDEALAPPAGMTLQAIGPQLRDFADTAAVIANLDLVISVDTAVAHLAGAMGKPCWLLLPDYRCDWRWMTERSDTPWYPSMRLFRQPEGGGWAPVIAEVAAALAELCQRTPAASDQA
ncbi:tetratricopeptide repeat protein [Duganella sp. BJB1802]|uniref:tetratricopeptide repeat protein n=1 Tax=Duganella sp. BJB1802 TaxID=2744575 RepID=UPI0015948CD2|nr:tetratricopeptide repeat protein [Duganella sp. BJB1802]NVD70067.1 tetratricopeptide repeat protein [Duganella sp. BJB1802]